MLIDSERLKQAILTIMPERSEVLLIVDNQPEVIVRCKDCKHQDPDRFDDGEGNYVCRKGHGWKPDNWFCADGERKDN